MHGCGQFIMAPPRCPSALWFFSKVLSTQHGGWRSTFSGHVKPEIDLAWYRPHDHDEWAASFGDDIVIHVVHVRPMRIHTYIHINSYLEAALVPPSPSQSWMERCRPQEPLKLCSNIRLNLNQRLLNAPVVQHPIMLPPVTLSERLRYVSAFVRSFVRYHPTKIKQWRQASFHLVPLLSPKLTRSSCLCREDDGVSWRIRPAVYADRFLTRAHVPRLQAINPLDDQSP